MWWSDDRRAPRAIEDRDERDTGYSDYESPFVNPQDDMPRSLEVRPTKQQQNYKSEALQHLSRPADYMGRTDPLNSSLDLLASSRELRWTRVLLKNICL